MARQALRTVDLADRIGSTNMAKNDREQALMALRQSENLLDILQELFGQARRVRARMRHRSA